MKKNPQLEKKREFEIEDLISNPIVTNDFEAIFTRKNHGGQVAFKLLTTRINKLWGSLVKDGIILFRIMEDVNVIVEGEYLQFRKDVEELVLY